MANPTGASGGNALARIGFRHRLPVFVFTFVLALTAVALCKPLWDASRRRPDLADRAARDSRLRDLCLQAMRLDGELTLSARSAVEGLPRGPRPYRAAEDDLGLVMSRIRSASAGTPSPSVWEGASSALRALESRALDRVREGKPDEARALLDDSEYEGLKRAFSREMARLVDRLWQAADAKAAEDLRNRRVATGVTVTLVCCLLLAWLMLHMTLRHWQRTLTQINLQLSHRTQELSELNRTLDRRVAERTAEIDRANLQIKENQAQLVHSEKMAALGQIAAGVAHEINNPVGFVMSNVNTMASYARILKRLLAEYERLSDAVQAGHAEEARTLAAGIREMQKEEDLPYILQDVDHLLAESAEGALRIKEIVQGLKSFVRLDEAEVQEADVNECVEATLKVVWNELKYKCRLHKRLSPLPRIRCFPGQLNQVFVNLLLNAAQAIPEQGDVTVETGVLDGAVQVRIADTGVGIPKEHLPHIFTPFFTTKPAGKGTGLGLSISYGIVRKHGGTLTAESEAGKGTVFTLRLPLGKGLA